MTGGVRQPCIGGHQTRPMADAQYIPRQAQRLVDEALSDTPIVAINGPRQVGKSTLATGVLQRHGGVLVTLDDETQRAVMYGNAAKLFG